MRSAACAPAAKRFAKIGSWASTRACPRGVIPPDRFWISVASRAIVSCPLRTPPTCLYAPSTCTSVVPAEAPQLVLVAAPLLSPWIAVLNRQTVELGFGYGHYAGDQKIKQWRDKQQPVTERDSRFEDLKLFHTGYESSLIVFKF